MTEFTSHIAGPETFRIRAVNHSQESLRAICGPPDKWKGESKRVRATLRSDSGRVEVLIDGHRVAFMDDKRAGMILAALAKKGFAGLNATCDAMIVGGRTNRSVVGRAPGDGAAPYFVNLDIFTSSERKAAQQSPPAPKEFEFTMNAVEPEALAGKVGKRVNFWSPHDDPSKIFVFASGGVGGTGKIGPLPPKLFPVVRKQLDSGRPIETKILEVTGAACRIWCRFVTAEQKAAEEVEANNKLAATLQKPFRPRQPVNFSVDAEKRTLRQGDSLELVRVPSESEFLADDFKLTFRSPRLGGEYVVDDSTLTTKVIRMRLCYSGFEIEVREKTGERSEQDANGHWQDVNIFRVELSPVKS